MIVATCTQEPTPLQQLAPHVPDDIALIVHRALEANPDDRYADADEMRIDLEREIGGLDQQSLAATVNDVEMNATVRALREAHGVMTPKEVPMGERLAKDKPLRWAFLTIVILLVVLNLRVWFWVGTR